MELNFNLTSSLEEVSRACLLAQDYFLIWPFIGIRTNLKNCVFSLFCASISWSCGFGLSCPCAACSNCSNCVGFVFCASFWDAPQKTGFSFFVLHVLYQIIFTLFFTTVLGDVTGFSTDKASIVSGAAPCFIGTLASSGVVLKFNFNFLAIDRGIVQSVSIKNYSTTACEASSPSLYSINAKQYLLL